MGDIRLKTITIDSNPLYIKNGTVSILNTSISTSFIDGSFIVNGGISVNCTHNSLSSTSGGALTIGGGVGISKNVFLGQNLKMDNSIGIFEISGLSNPRLKIDSVINKTCSISPDGVNTRFLLDDTKLILSSTQTSINSTTGALVLSGGLSISSTENSISPSVGGCFTIAGGVGICKDLNVGTKISIGQSNSQIVIGSDLNSSNNGFFLNYVSNYNAGVISGQTNTNILLSPFSGNVGIRTTSPNFTLDVNGTINALSFTGGNVYMSGDIFTDSISTASASITTATIPNLFTDTMLIGEVSMSNMTTGILYSIDGYITNLSSSNVKTTNETIENLISITQTGGSAIFTGIASASNLISTTQTGTSAIFTQIASAANLISTTQTGANVIFTQIASVANLVSTTSTLGSSITTTASVGTLLATNISSENLLIDGNYYTMFEGSNLPYPVLNVSGGTLIEHYYNPMNPVESVNIHNLTALEVRGYRTLLGTENNIIFNKLEFSRTDGNPMLTLYEQNPDELLFSSGLSFNFENKVFMETSGNIGIGTTQPFVKMDISGDFRVTGGNSMLTWNCNTVGSIITTGGNVGIGLVNPSYRLDVNGIISGQMYTGSNIQISGKITSGTIYVSDSINSNSSSTGSIVTLGGLGVKLDSWLDGNLNIKGITNYFSSTEDVINFYNSNTKKLSISKTSGDDLFFARYNGTQLVEQSIVLYYTSGSVLINNTTSSTSVNNACFITNGGITIRCTENSIELGNGGSLSVYGGGSISKNLNIGGNLTIYSSQDSSDVSTGALVVSGGLGVGKNLNVLGNTVIAGNLIVQGTSTSVETSNTTLKDNIIVLNAGPSGSRDSGFVINRYQEDNNTGSGDVVNDTEPLVFRLGDQTGLNNTEVKLPSEASGSNDFYKNWWIKITSGFSNDQVRKIISYNGSTKIATVSTAWNIQNPANNDYVSLYNKPYVGLFYNETNDIFVFGSTVGDPGQSIVDFTDKLKIQFGKANITSSEVSSNLSSGSLILNGGITINCTEDSSSLTAGGTITTTGGISVGKTLRTKDLYINGVRFTPNTGDIMTSQTFLANNNQSSFANITGLVFDSNVLGIDIYLSVKIAASTNLYSNFHIRGINKGNSWEIVKTYVGDDTGIEFNMTNSGQLQYTTQNYTGASEINFIFKAFTN